MHGGQVWHIPEVTLKCCQALNWPERQFTALSLPQYAAIKYRQYQANQQTQQQKKSKVAGNNLTVLPIDKEKQKTVRTN